MAKSDIIALLAEGGVLRAVRFSPRGRDGWARTGGGVWPLEIPDQASEGEEEASAGEDGDAPARGEAGVLAVSDTPMGRALTAARDELGCRKVVIALPLSKLVTKVLRVPMEMREDLLDAVTLQMDKLSPFPGEEQAVGCEVLSETEKDLWVLAAAMPSAVFNGISEVMRATKLQVVRTDVSILGWFRSLCGPCKLTRPGRHALLMNPDGEWDLMVLDHGVPVLVRGLGVKDDTEALTRELMLSLMNAELEAGSAPLADIQIVTASAPSDEMVNQLQEAFQTTVSISRLPGDDLGAEGIALRAGEGAAMDLTPQAWRDEIKEQAVRKRVLTGTGIAAAIWLLFMGTLLAGPIVYGKMTQHVRKKARTHAAAYKQVSDTRDRVNLILSYTDRQRSPLELLLQVADALPEGATLTSLTYKRTDGIKVSAESDQATMVYDFKDAITENPLFETVNLTGPSVSKGRNKFDVNAVFKGSGQKK